MISWGQHQECWKFQPNLGIRWAICRWPMSSPHPQILPPQEIMSHEWHLASRHLVLIPDKLDLIRMLRDKHQKWWNHQPNFSLPLCSCRWTMSSPHSRSCQPKKSCEKMTPGQQALGSPYQTKSITRGYQGTKIRIGGNSSAIWVCHELCAVNLWAVHILDPATRSNYITCHGGNWHFGHHTR